MKEHYEAEIARLEAIIAQGGANHGIFEVISPEEMIEGLRHNIAMLEKHGDAVPSFFDLFEDDEI